MQLVSGDAGSELAALDAATDAHAVTADRAEGGGGAEDADAVADAGATASCAERCLVAGGTCEDGTCMLSCPGHAGCGSVVTCPPGVPCRITCTGKEACKTVSCGEATRCTVLCEGEQACKGKVSSMATDTSITCTGKDACDTDVTCSGATCAVTCSSTDGRGCDPAKVRCCASACTYNGSAGTCPP